MINKVVGVICAMDLEIEYFKKNISNVTEQQELHYKFYCGKLGTNIIIFTKCGIGKANAAALTAIFIDKFHPDFIFNSGIAGAYNRSLKTLDIVVAEKVFYSDVDMTSDEWTDLAYGQLQDLPPYFVMNQELISLVARQSEDFKYGSIMTGDQFVVDYDKTNRIVQEHFACSNVLACDMESAAIAQICFLNDVPVLIVRAISDVIGSRKPLDYAKFSPLAADKAASIIVDLLIK